MSNKATLRGRAGVATLMIAMAVFGLPGSAGALPGPCAIEASGTFHLDGPHECIGDGIVVTSNNTKIFLDGHTLTGDGFSTGIFGATFDKIKIFGPGTLTGWGIAVDLTGSDKSKIFDVSALNSETGFLVVGNKNHLQDNIASNNDAWGMEVTGQKNHLEANTLDENGSGVKMSGDKSKAIGKNVVTGSNATGGTDGDAFFVPAGQKVSVSGNTAFGNAGMGVNSLSNYITIHQNLLQNNAGLGANAPDVKKVKGVSTCIGNNPGGGGVQSNPLRLCNTPPD